LDRDPKTKRDIVRLIMYYLVFMIIGDFVAYFIGPSIERTFGSQVSLIAFLALYFLSLWISWILAVRLTAKNDDGELAPAGSP
jgi:cation transporter-like permease